MLQIEGLQVKQGAFALSADLTLPTAGVTALIGPSGAGKSTFLAAIAGFLAPQAGRILWQGADLTGLAPGARPVSVLFQDNNLFPHLTAADNIGLGLCPRLRLSAAQKADVQAALAAVGLAGLGGRRPAALSGGQQSRVALARVMVADRPLVLLDEPFAALGPALKAEMLDLLGEKLNAGGRTILMVTHDPRDAERIADQVVVVADGRAAPPQDTATLFAAPPPALARYLGA